MRYIITIALLITLAIPVTAQDDCTTSDIQTAALLIAPIVSDFTAMGTELSGQMDDQDIILEYFAQASDTQYNWLFEIKPSIPQCNELNPLIITVDDLTAAFPTGLFNLYIGNTDRFEDYMQLSIDSMEDITVIATDLMGELDND